MKRYGRIVFVSLILLTMVATLAHAQTVLDPSCWKPRIGNGIDEKMVSMKQIPYFGADIAWFPAPKDDTDHLYFTINDEKTEPYYPLIYRSPKPFDLSKLEFVSVLRIKNDGGSPQYGVRFGHFHDAVDLDMLIPVDVRNHGRPSIYWADSLGRYDTSHVTFLWSSLQGNDHPEGGYGFSLAAPLVIGPMDNDTVDDILMELYTNWTPYQVDLDSSRYGFAFFHGGEQLYESVSPVLSDSVYEFPDWKPRDTVKRDPTRDGFIGDFNGDGRIDVVYFDAYGNCFYCQSSRAFSLAKYYQASEFDTLISVSQNLHLLPQLPPSFEYPPMQALPRKPDDHSVDLLIPLQTDGFMQNSIWIFRGGVEFGTKRLTVDTGASVSGEFQQAEFILRHPGVIDPAYKNYHWGGFITQCGDITGTGRPVIKTNGEGGAFSPGTDYYYVLGDAIDDKADIAIGYEQGATVEAVDVNADNDKFADVLFQAYSTYSNGSLTPDSSGLLLLHGSPKIPIHLNQKYAVPVKLESREELGAYPNPATRGTTVTFRSSGERVTVSLVDLLGHVVMSVAVDTDPNLTTMYFPLQEVEEGSYQLVAKTKQGTVATSVIVKR
ncbi:MAG: T9SS type A sorting domain-containing protein [Bacteroidetes bacterium]|nr:T9SS type A sorting domain-containing protein [Bacteroidota bacterium]